ncbi:hypothetical protein Gpo141_00004083 [Globisporangium polare]
MHRLLHAPVETRACVGAALILTVSLMLGLTLDANANIPEPWNRVSSIIGWVYFSCWSVGFYPQILLNHARRSVVGLSLDYVVLSLFGFVCYAIFNCAFYYSESVQQQYVRLHDGHRNAVEVNDVFFSVHASVLASVSLLQSFIYTRGGQSVGSVTSLLTGSLIGLMALFGGAVLITGNNESSSLPTTLNFLYLLSYVKLALTLGKCIPQILLNYQRKSTAGWAIWNVYLGIIGGVLSIAQQVLDSAATHDWSAITGDPVKFFLGFVSIAVDVVFFLQHYVWYSEPADSGSSNGFSIKARSLEIRALLP